MSKSVLISLVVIIILLLGGWLLIGRNEITDTLNENPDEVFCTMDAMQCPDGSFVGRVAPNCEFAACPNTSTGTPATSIPEETITVTYTNSGFSPGTITILRGQSVTFINQSDEDMWVASDDHPTHSLYDGTTREEHCGTATTAIFDQCGRGATRSSWAFTFNKVGTWKYHNHVESDHEATITVN